MSESTGYTDSDSFVLILVHMIDDRMTLSDPVEEFVFLPVKRHYRAGSLCPGPCVTRVEEAGCSKSGAFIWTVMSQEVRSYPVSCLCRDSQGIMVWLGFPGVGVSPFVPV
ncbi:hypothetical protein GOODEAATRI_030927 [Goodea atripinnis]|uniref:Uncharacterized protein n=1 Tax=Goodea atripinnis TaxID=208336 RepID=A0ABV0NF67_9TELE